MNFIPDSAVKTGNYFCTWDSQCDEMHTKNPGAAGVSGRDAMCDGFLFGECGLLKSFDRVRGDLIAVLDDGWDVPYGAKDSRLFGSLAADEERFPLLRDMPPEQRLKALSDKVCSLGYRGLGLWVPTQTPSLINGTEVVLTPREERKYWEERAKWCHEAGILYLKADWGAHQGDADYCRMMTECMREYAPGLMIEHGLTGRPLFETRESGYSVPDGVKEYLRKVLPVSDYLRTYDVVHELKYASTVDRASICLEAAAGIDGRCAVLNIEDTALIGAGLGCAVGVMRHELEKRRKYLPLPPRPVYESECVLRWQRIAPPFAANIGRLYVSGERLKDVWHCPRRAKNLWPDVEEGDYYVSAPAAVSRNMPLPQVDADGEKPFVVCSVHPDTGALCVAVTPRTTGGEIDITPPADIRVRGGSVCAPIGVFGSFDSLTVDFDEPTDGYEIYAQNLASDSALNVTRFIARSGASLTVPGKLMFEVGCPEGDKKAIPAIMLKLVKSETKI